MSELVDDLHGTAGEVSNGKYDRAECSTILIQAANRIESLTAEREQCCELVIAASLATGPADTTVELMQEVLAQVDEIRAERDALKAEVLRRTAECMGHDGKDRTG